MFDISSDVLNVFVVVAGAATAVAVHSMADSVDSKIFEFACSKCQSGDSSHNYYYHIQWMMFESYLHCTFDFYLIFF